MKFSDVAFLEVDEVERLHESVIADAGGSYGVRDRGLLESAVAAPRTYLFGAPAYASLAGMAAALAHAIVKNHAFVDGNKRAALVGVLTFIELNGIRISPVPLAEWLRAFESLADGSLKRDALIPIFAEAMRGDVEIDVD